MQADILSKNHRNGEAAVLYSQLRKEYPDNKSIQESYANFLIENEQYKQASLVLSQ